MYHHFYHLKHDPFTDSPDPEFLFLSPGHKTALQVLLDGIERRRGTLGIFGAAGLGKTILLHAFLEGIHEQQRLRTIQIFYPKISSQDLFEMLFRGLGLTCKATDLAERVYRLHNALLAEYQAGWSVAMLVDDAQDMSEQTLATLLQLATLQTTSGVPLLQVVLVGLPTLWPMLKASPFCPDMQRGSTYATLAPLSPQESLAYIRHRLAKVLMPEEALFMPGTSKHIVRAGRGNPRILNTLCASVLITGVLHEQKPISPSLAKEVIAESGETSSRSLFWRGSTLAAGLLLSAGIWWGWQSSWWPSPSTPSLPHAAIAPRHSASLYDAGRNEVDAKTMPASSQENPGAREKVPGPRAGPLLRDTVQREANQREGPSAGPVAKKPEKNLPVKPPLPSSKSPIPAPGPETARAPTPRRPTVSPVLRTVNVRSYPYGATVTIDRKVYGKTPLRVQLDLGTHTITLDKPGYRRMSYDINLHNHPSGDLYYALQTDGGDS